MIENHAGHAHPEQSQESHSIIEARSDTHQEREHRQRLLVWSWLKATNPETDQSRFSSIRAEHPGTGQWLLENEVFNDWFHPKFVTIPPLLWLKGLPGAGNISTSPRRSAK